MTTSEALDQDRLLEEFRGCGALLEGHFLLTSGLHSPYYLQCARVLMAPARAERLCAALRQRLEQTLPGLSIDATVAPALGGVIFGYELARQLGATSMFVERVEGRFALRRGFTLAPGDRVLLAEDVVTTGRSSRECIDCVRAAGAEVVAAACLIDRSGGKAELGIPLVGLATLDLPVYPADRLPPDLARLPVAKPGSRPTPGRSQGR